MNANRRVKLSDLTTVNGNMRSQRFVSPIKQLAKLLAWKKPNALRPPARSTILFLTDVSRRETTIAICYWRKEEIFEVIRELVRIPQ